jgi:hypothetical protein
MARRERGACPHAPVTSEQRRQAPESALARRVALLDGLRCVARRSQIHWGYAPSSRLAQAKNQSATRHAWVFQQSLNQRSGSRAADLHGKLWLAVVASAEASRTHLINRERVRCWRFGAAARREEGEYPSWIFDRRATPLQRQISATLRAKLWRAAGGVAPQSQSAIGYASSSRLASRPPGLSALIPYL